MDRGEEGWMEGMRRKDGRRGGEGRMDGGEEKKGWAEGAVCCLEQGGVAAGLIIQSLAAGPG